MFYAERRPQYSILVERPTPAPARPGDDAKRRQLMQGALQVTQRSAGQAETGLSCNASTPVAENLTS